MLTLMLFVLLPVAPAMSKLLMGRCWCPQVTAALGGPRLLQLACVLGAGIRSRLLRCTQRKLNLPVAAQDELLNLLQNA